MRARCAAQHARAEEAAPCPRAAAPAPRTCQMDDGCHLVPWIQRESARARGRGSARLSTARQPVARLTREFGMYEVPSLYRVRWGAQQAGGGRGLALFGLGCGVWTVCAERGRKRKRTPTRKLDGGRRGHRVKPAAAQQLKRRHARRRRPHGWRCAKARGRPWLDGGRRCGSGCSQVTCCRSLVPRASPAAVPMAPAAATPPF